MNTELIAGNQTPRTRPPGSEGVFERLRNAWKGGNLPNIDEYLPKDHLGGRAVLVVMRSPSQRYRMLVAATLGLTLVVSMSYLFGGTLVRFATNKGELVVQVNDPSTIVAVKQTGVVVRDRSTQRQFVFTAGEGEVNVHEPASGLKVTTRKFTLEHGGKTYVNVTQNVAKAPDPERRAAEWALSMKAQVVIVAGGRKYAIGSGPAWGPDTSPLAELPAGELKVATIWRIDNSPDVKDAGLANLEGLTSIDGLCLPNAGISDAGMAFIGNLTSLQKLLLPGAHISDAGIAHVKRLANLGQLALSDTQISDAGLVHLARLTNLHNLNLSGTRISGAGLLHLKTLTNLNYLELNSTRVNDSGLEHLRSLTKLGGLHITGTQVSDNGTVHLKALKNLYSLQLGRTQVSNSALKHLATLTNLQYLHLESTEVGDAGLQSLQGLTALRVLRLSNTHVTDGGLVHLKTLNKLAVLDLDGASVGDAGLQHLCGLRDLRRLNLTGTKVTAQGVLALQKILAQCQIAFGPK